MSCFPCCVKSIQENRGGTGQNERQFDEDKNDTKLSTDENKAEINGRNKTSSEITDRNKITNEVKQKTSDMKDNKVATIKTNRDHDLLLGERKEIIQRTGKRSKRRHS